MLKSVSFGYKLSISNFFSLIDLEYLLVDKIYLLAYYDHFRLHLGVYIVFACIIAYHMVKIAEIEVWSQTEKRKKSQQTILQIHRGPDCNIKIIGLI